MRGSGGEGDGDAEAGRGTASLDEHVDRADGGPAAQRYRPPVPKRSSSPAPLEEVTAHLVGVPEHWHLVTYGLSDLRSNRSAEAELSGWGFELTFRVARDEGEGEAPRWAEDFLSSLAAYVWSSGHPFAPGHHLDLRGPIRLDSDSAITAAAIAEDPVLDALDGPFGRVEFFQVVGLTADELELCRSWSTEGVLELVGRDDPMLVTRLDRASVAADPRWRGEIAERVQSDGSALHELRVATLLIRRRFGRGVVAQMGAGAASALGPAIRRELVGVGAAFTVYGDEAELRFEVGPEAGWVLDDDLMTVTVPLERVEAMGALFDGTTGWARPRGWPGLRFRVVP